MIRKYQLVAKKIPTRFWLFLALAWLGWCLVMVLVAKLVEAEPRFSIGDCYAVGSGTNFDFRFPKGTWGTQDTASWRREQCDMAAEWAEHKASHEEYSRQLEVERRQEAAVSRSRSQERVWRPVVPAPAVSAADLQRNCQRIGDCPTSASEIVQQIQKSQEAARRLGTGPR